MILDPELSVSELDDDHVPTVQLRIENLRRHFKVLQTELQAAQVYAKFYADQDRRNVPEFTVGDQVWLLSRNIATTRPNKKLDFKRLGPFKVLSQVNRVAYQLELPPSWKIHNVFHVSLLLPVHSDSPVPWVDRYPPPPPPELIDGYEEFEVQAILDSRYRHRKLQYLVDWKGMSPQERTWEPATHLRNSPDLIKDFHDRYPVKPGPRVTLPKSRKRSTQEGGNVMNALVSTPLPVADVTGSESSNGTCFVIGDSKEGFDGTFNAIGTRAHDQVENGNNSSIKGTSLEVLVQ
jgi:hypothetical protein